MEAAFVLLLTPSVSGPINCTWTATATNLPAVAKGELSIPLAVEQVDLLHVACAP